MNAEDMHCATGRILSGEDLEICQNLRKAERALQLSRFEWTEANIIKERQVTALCAKVKCDKSIQGIGVAVDKFMQFEDGENAEILKGSLESGQSVIDHAYIYLAVFLFGFGFRFARTAAEFKRSRQANADE